MESEVRAARSGAPRGEGKSGLDDAKTRRSLFHAAHDIKGEAETFGFPSRRGRPTACAADRAHARHGAYPLCADRSACRCDPRHRPRERAHGHRRDRVSTLTAKLRQVTDEFLAYENRDRPDVSRRHHPRAAAVAEREYVAGVIRAVPRLDPAIHVGPHRDARVTRERASGRLAIGLVRRLEPSSATSSSQNRRASSRAASVAKRRSSSQQRPDFAGLVPLRSA